MRRHGRPCEGTGPSFSSSSMTYPMEGSRTLGLGRFSNIHLPCGDICIMTDGAIATMTSADDMSASLPPRLWPTTAVLPNRRTKAIAASSSSRIAGPIGAMFSPCPHRSMTSAAVPLSATAAATPSISSFDAPYPWHTTAPPRGEAGTKRKAGMACPSGAVRSLTRRKSISPSGGSVSLRALSCLGLESREARPHLLLLLPERGHVLDHGGRALKLSCGRAKENDVELDRDPRSVFFQGRHRQRVAAVLRDPARHHSGPAFPVPRSLLLGNDEIQRLSERFLRSIAEHGLGSVVPEADLPFPIREEDRDRAVLDDSLIQPAVVSGLGHEMFLREDRTLPARIIHGHPAETRATLGAKECCDRKPMTSLRNSLSATEIFRRDKEARRRRPSPGVRGTRRSPARPSPSQRSADAVSVSIHEQGARGAP